MMGNKVQEEEQNWQLLMSLKELVMSPTHTKYYPDILIAVHRKRCSAVAHLALFCYEKSIPKHHFEEHYPQLIK